MDHVLLWVVVKSCWDCGLGAWGLAVAVDEVSRLELCRSRPFKDCNQDLVSVHLTVLITGRHGSEQSTRLPALWAGRAALWGHQEL